MNRTIQRITAWAVVFFAMVAIIVAWEPTMKLVTGRDPEGWGQVIYDLMYAERAEEPDTTPDYHIVEPGQTLWSIARKYWPTAHIGERVYMLREINGIDPMIHTGQIIRLKEASDVD